MNSVVCLDSVVGMLLWLFIGMFLLGYLLFQMWKHECPKEYHDYKVKKYRKEHPEDYWCERM